MNSIVLYGEYTTTNAKVKNLLKRLTNGRFKFGAISQKIVKRHWAANKTLTYATLAELWTKEYENGDIDYDELAYNNFMKQHGDKNEWAKLKKEVTNKFKIMGLL